MHPLVRASGQNLNVKSELLHFLASLSRLTPQLSGHSKRYFNRYGRYKGHVSHAFGTSIFASKFRSECGPTKVGAYSLGKDSRYAEE